MNHTPHYNPEEEPTPEIPRNKRGGLPVWMVLVCLAIFALGFWLFRQWRGQYVDYSGTFSFVEVSPLLQLSSLLG